MPASGAYFDERDPKGRAFRTKVLLVEGIDDAYFFDKILTLQGAPTDEVGILIINGIGNLEDNIADLVKSRAYVTKSIKHIAVFRDADASVEAAIERLNEALNKSGLPSISGGAFVSYDSNRAVGGFVLPNCTDAGILEDLLLSASDADPRIAPAENYLTTVEQFAGPLDRRSKRMMQVFLAARPEDCRGPGRAFGLGVIPAAHPSFSPLTEFIQGMLAL